MKQIVILGSTGSIGTQALSVIRENKDRFSVFALFAGGNNLDLLEKQIKEFAPRFVAVANKSSNEKLRSKLLSSETKVVDTDRPELEILREFAGKTDQLTNQKTNQLAEQKVGQRGGQNRNQVLGLVLNAIGGSPGLFATLEALKLGQTLALANKESLVIGGKLVLEAAQRQGQIVPVDSEHSAIAQSLLGYDIKQVNRIILTASGGPFRKFSTSELENVKVEQALKHPNWNMGNVITINSATMINKGLEYIEARYLFNIKDITVLIHPQSIIHSMVQYNDGGIICQASLPDMKLPISMAFDWPNRFPIINSIDFSRTQQWEFFPLQDIPEVLQKGVLLAKQALDESPLHPVIFNNANEILVDKFLHEKIRFTDIINGIADALNTFDASAFSHGNMPTLDEIENVDKWIRAKLV